MLKATQLAGLGRRPVTGGNDHLTMLIIEAGANGTAIFADASNGGAYGNRHQLSAVGNVASTNAVALGGRSTAIVFDGSGDAIDCGTHADWDLRDHDFTVELWCRPSSIAAAGNPGRGLISNFDGTTKSGFALWLDNAAAGTPGNLLSNFGNYGGSGATSISAGSSYHIAMSRDGANLRLFVNGVQKSLITLPDGYAAPAPVRPLLLGRNPFGGGGSTGDYHGYEGGIRLSKGVARYTANFTPPTTPWKSWE